MADDTPTLIFCGTPAFAIPCLEALDEKFKVAAVICQPDKPVGRGLEVIPPAVKVAAAERRIPCFQPRSIKSITFSEAAGFAGGGPSAQSLVQFLNGARPIDAFIVVAYGKMIPRAMMDGASAGVINVHASLLPRWRGAAPIQRAIASGDKVTGITIMQIDEGLDTGPVFASRPLELEARETSGSLHQKLSVLGAELLCESLPGILDGSLQAKPQGKEGVQHAPKWERPDMTINWERSAEEIDRQIRACAPYPGARATFRGNLIKIFAARPEQSYAAVGKNPGTVLKCDRQNLLVAAGGGSCLALERLQLPGKRPLDVADFLAGASIQAGEVLT